MNPDSPPTETISVAEITADARLVMLVASSHGVVEYPLLFPEPTVVGRVAPADICINDRSISRQHARIGLCNGLATVEDLGSRNGTFVNNERVSKNGTPIRIGDALRIGGVVVQLILRARESSAAELTLAEQLEADLTSEVERCLRNGKSVALMMGEVEIASPSMMPRTMAGRMLSVLRARDLVALRSSIGFDVLVRDCEKHEAAQLAARMLEVLAPISRSARIGIAVAPADAATRERLRGAALEAMQAVSKGVSLAPDMPEVRRLGNRDIVVADTAMVRVFRHAERAASLGMHVLLEGETGVGKEIVADAIHLLGMRAHRPLVKVNCASLPENLIESELFGYERGAFSGANAPKPGLVERAHGGTLFLDEIGELPLALQAKLLRFVEDKRLTRLGGTTERFVEVRIIAATHRNLRNEVAAGRFRQDLFFRLNTLKIDIPPLRERRREIALLARRFAEQAASDVGRVVPTITDAAFDVLQQHDWPGNIREIRNVMTHAIVFCDDEAMTKDHILWSLGQTVSADSSGALATPVVARREEPAPTLPDAPVVPKTPASLAEELAGIERERIVATLEACGGNQTRAAKQLGIPRRTFVSRMAALGIPNRRASHRQDD